MYPWLMSGSIELINQDIIMIEFSASHALKLGFSGLGIDLDPWRSPIFPPSRSKNFTDWDYCRKLALFNSWVVICREWLSFETISSVSFPLILDVTFDMPFLGVNQQQVGLQKSTVVVERTRRCRLLQWLWYQEEIMNYFHCFVNGDDYTFT